MQHSHENEKHATWFLHNVPSNLFRDKIVYNFDVHRFQNVRWLYDTGILVYS